LRRLHLTSEVRERAGQFDWRTIQGDNMSNTGQILWQQTTGTSPKNACPHCGSAQRHEVWCITTNVSVRYAYAIVLSPSLLTPGDALILHSLGVIW
jgi:hypothetical protein